MRFIVAILMALCLFGTVQADDSIVIVLDTSGSMGEYMRSAGKTRMEVAQQALIDVLSQVPDTTKIGILSFDGWIYPIGPVDRSKLETAIRSTRPSGGTPLYEYMRGAGTALLKERAQQLNVGSYKMLVITDGEAGDDRLNDPSRFEDGTTRPGVLDDIMSRNITVDTIALDMASDHALKRSINGTYMKGDDPQSLTKAVSDAVAEVGYGDSQDASDSAFAEIADLPDEAAVVILKGLSTFPNYGIGEQPPVITVVDDGVVVQEVPPQTVPELGQEESSNFTGFILGFLGVCLGLFVLFVIINVARGMQ